MGLLSIFKRSTDTAAEAPAAAAPDAVAVARTRARQRLIGASVLLGVGVIGFPLLFETQPRPVAVDIPIEIPRKDGVPPLALPAPKGLPAPSPASAAVLSADGNVPARPREVAAEMVERADEAGREVADTASAAVRAAGASATARPSAAASKPAVAPAAPADDGARAQALLDGQPASSPAVRMVVQVGAYGDPDKLREARQRLEALGLKTYTQVVEVDGVKRTRVRVGPFASRAEADKAAARIKAAGLPAAILSL